MTKSSVAPSYPTPMQSWLLTIAVIFFSLFGVILSLICIYALPDGTIQPKLGSIFFICSAVVIVAVFLVVRRKERAVLRQLTENQSTIDVAITPIQAGISEKILQWVVMVFGLLFAFSSISLALICIYALPDYSMQPQTGLIYLLGGTFVVGCFIYAVWKNR